MSPAAPRAARLGRIGAAAVVLAGLVLISARLLPVYLGNWQFQRFLEEFTLNTENQATSDDLVRLAIVNRASQLGLPVRSDQIRLSRAPQRLGIEVRYVVPVDLTLYSVDLHFRPRAGQR